MQELSPRLQLLAEMVPQGAKVLDVGTDHAYLPLWLLRKGRVTAACASDIALGPLAAAAAHAQDAGLASSLRLVQCDGLVGFGSEDGDTVILAGMGGETIVNILAAAPWINQEKLLLLQPMSKQAYLRRWLQENCFIITAEHLAQEGEKIYNVLAAKPGRMPPLSPGELELGVFPLIRQAPLFPIYLKRIYGKLHRTAAGISAAANPELMSGRVEILTALTELKALIQTEERRV